MSEIRVTHTGLINLATGIARVVLSSIFILIITRSLSPEVYGQYNIILSMLAYLVASHWIISYWITRDVSRGLDSGKTAIVSSSIISSFGLLIFLIVGIFLHESLSLNFNIIILSSLIIPLQFIHNILTALCVGWKPHLSSYGNLAVDTVKIILITYFVFQSQLDLEQILFSLIASFLFSCSFLIFVTREKLKVSFSKSIFKNWLSRFWIPSYIPINSLIISLDLIIIGIFESPDVVGYYSAGLVIANFVSYSKLVTIGVYPKLIAKERGLYVNENFRLLLYFMILFTTICIGFTKPGLFVLNPIYQIISASVIFLTLRVFLFIIFDNFDLILRGTEQIDENQNARFKDFLKSKLFKLPSIKMIQYSIYVISLSLLIFIVDFKSISDLIFSWALLSFLIQIPATLILYAMIKKENILKIDFIPILKYLTLSVIMISLIHHFNSNYLEYSDDLLEMTSTILVLIVSSALIYFGATYLIDKNTRKLFKSIVKNFSK